jgi:hypothetical protein
MVGQKTHTCFNKLHLSGFNLLLIFVFDSFITVIKYIFQSLLKTL